MRPGHERAIVASLWLTVAIRQQGIYQPPFFPIPAYKRHRPNRRDCRILRRLRRLTGLPKPRKNRLNRLNPNIFLPLATALLLQLQQPEELKHVFVLFVQTQPT